MEIYKKTCDFNSLVLHKIKKSFLLKKKTEPFLSEQTKSEAIIVCPNCQKKQKSNGKVKEKLKIVRSFMFRCIRPIIGPIKHKVRLAIAAEMYQGVHVISQHIAGLKKEMVVLNISLNRLSSEITTIKSNLEKIEIKENFIETKLTKKNEKDIL